MEKDQKLNRILELLPRYYNDSLDDEETTELEQWLNERPENRSIFEELKNGQIREAVFRKMDSYDEDAALRELKRHIAPKPLHRRRKMRYSVAAAAIVLLIAAGFILLKENKSVHPGNKSVAIAEHDVPPGGNKAILTLANGKQIVLDSNANGLLAQQGNMQVINLSAGQLGYKAGGGNAGKNETSGYNTLATPRGGQYEVTLPDGSRVWMNAASSLKYPTAFMGKDRTVTLTGEAYFEVVHNENKPFTVSVNETVIKDIGTEFNINAYKSGPVITTTVVKGAVSVSGQKTVVLTAGKQALSAGNDVQVRNVPDIKKVIAWKEGLFWFNEESITEVMDQIARWYNVDVEYRGHVTAHFSGSIHRDVNVSVVFKVLEETGGVHFRIDGRKIIVTP